MRVLYLDLFSGISGDMTMGALLDAGATESALREGLSSLGIDDEFELVVQKKNKAGIAGTDVDVVIKELSPDLLHEKQHALGLEHHHGHEHDHGEEHHHHDHEHPHDHHHGAGHHHHHGNGLRRNIVHIVDLIQRSGLSEAVKADSIAVFRRLAQAEAAVHGTSPEEVHFHEVGAVDAIVDIVGNCILFHDLAPDHIAASPVHVGSGRVKIEHGVVPAPAPATLRLLAGIPIYGGDVKGELVTPTGAALLGHFAQEFGPMPAMRPLAVGYGHGKKDFGGPNSLRVCLGESEDEKKKN